MKLKFEFPPNIEKIKKVLQPSDSALFCHGDTIYSPHLKANQIDTAYIVHESVHARQQQGKPDEWWDEYLANPVFRLSQELDAYRVQYRFNTKSGLSRDQLALRLSHMAQALSSSMYGSVISYGEAAKQIRELSPS